MATKSKAAEAGETRLDNAIDKPSTTAPGDGPADTTDPAERAVSVSPDAAAAAMAGHQTVNSVVPVTTPVAERDTSNDRYEEYDGVDPSTGAAVRVRRNLETGESERI